MRQILFKAKRIDNGEWVEGSLIQSPYMGEIRSWISSPDDKTRLRAIATYYGDWRAVEVRTDTICQYTGLTDKNGNKIWENDICDRKEKYPEIVKYREGDYVLDYSYALGKEDGNSYCNLGFYVCERKYVEVIGNIFDNPELLKGGA